MTMTCLGPSLRRAARCGRPSDTSRHATLKRRGDCLSQCLAVANCWWCRLGRHRGGLSSGQAFGTAQRASPGAVCALIDQVTTGTKRDIHFLEQTQCEDVFSFGSHPEVPRVDPLHLDTSNSSRRTVACAIACRSSTSTARGSTTILPISPPTRAMPK